MPGPNPAVLDAQLRPLLLAHLDRHFGGAFRGLDYLTTAALLELTRRLPALKAAGRTPGLLDGSGMSEGRRRQLLEGRRGPSRAVPLYAGPYSPPSVSKIVSALSERPAAKASAGRLKRLLDLTPLGAAAGRRSGR